VKLTDAFMLPIIILCTIQDATDYLSFKFQMIKALEKIQTATASVTKAQNL